MFDLIGDDIALLSDSDLRTLVARLAAAELQSQDLPVAGVTAGGHQDAADGGIDVRARLSKLGSKPDFVPRTNTGFQVKVPDMPPSAITEEMRPKGVLRPVIDELIQSKGAYIIVSAQGTLADARLNERVQAMRDAVKGVSGDADLHVDFYDRVRLATWTKLYPGAELWVREKIGKALNGWRAVSAWSSGQVVDSRQFLFGAEDNLIDERKHPYRRLTVANGVTELRALLKQPAKCVRLIGLSGVGKTRLAQVLFDANVGTDALDPALAIYTDYADEPSPSAKEMATRLVGTGQRAILIVDNCNPATHAAVAEVCGQADSQVSLLSIEYDLREDEPEGTDVFRLAPGSPALIERWLCRDFPDVSQVDRQTIAAFSDGNFRIAGAIARTICKGDSLASLTDTALFERIFAQRHQPSLQFLHNAQLLALPYSFDGVDDGSGGELESLAKLGTSSVTHLYAAMVELDSRGLLQARSTWRAVLPQAIANRLALAGLKRLPPSTFKQLATKASKRLFRSIARRLGYLHSSDEARTLLKAWIGSGGPLEDLRAVDDFAMISNLAPLAPDLILDRIEVALRLMADKDLPDPDQSRGVAWIQLLRSIAYDPQLFERCVLALGRFVIAEKPEGQRYATTHLRELFQIALSGTQADPATRRGIASKLCLSPHANERKLGAIALDGMLAVEGLYSSAQHDFGARKRDYGWSAADGQAEKWYEELLLLFEGLVGELHEPAEILARHLQWLWQYDACAPIIERLVDEFAPAGWQNGWVALRHARGRSISPVRDAHLESLIGKLEPADLLAEARAWVISRTLDNLDIVESGIIGDDDDSLKSDAAELAAQNQARDIGRRMAADQTLLASFLEELFAADDAARALEFGMGLAEGCTDLGALWALLTKAYLSAPDNRPAATLGGFVRHARLRDDRAVEAILDTAVTDRALEPIVPFLHVQSDLDDRALHRLFEFAAGQPNPQAFAPLRNAGQTVSDHKAFCALLVTISDLPNGGLIAIRALGRLLAHLEGAGKPPAKAMIQAGSVILPKLDYREHAVLQCSQARRVVRACIDGPSGVANAQAICNALRRALDEAVSPPQSGEKLLHTLFEQQPKVALETFLLPDLPTRNPKLFEGKGSASIVAAAPTAELIAWAQTDPDARYQQLARCLRLFEVDSTKREVLSPTFVDVLATAPDAGLFLGKYLDRIQTTVGWTGSRSVHLRRRHDLLVASGVPALEAFARTHAGVIDSIQAREQSRQIQIEDSFEEV